VDKFVVPRSGDATGGRGRGAEDVFYRRATGHWEAPELGCCPVPHTLVLFSDAWVFVLELGLELCPKPCTLLPFAGPLGCATDERTWHTRDIQG